MSKYSQFFAIINKLGMTKEEVISEFTNGKKNSLSALSASEYNSLMAHLQKYNRVPPGDAMRKKMIGIAKSMMWGSNDKIVLQRLDEWCLKQKPRKTLMRLDLAELSILLSIFETKVYPDYLKALQQ